VHDTFSGQSEKQAYLLQSQFHRQIAAREESNTSVINADTMSPARGGLPPRILRRVCEYIDGHLEKNVCLDTLAELANLSKYHFSRAFKKSVGIPPHYYLLKRRVQRAQNLLAHTKLPIAEIALAAGFSDQSHFARRFREHVGISPSTYRWNLS